MDTQNLNTIDLSQSDSNVKKEDPTKNVNVNIPYVDNTNIDLKSFDGSGGGTGGVRRHHQGAGQKPPSAQCDHPGFGLRGQGRVGLF